MQRHLPATKKLSVFFTRYVLQVTLIASCCFQWNAVSATDASRGIAGVSSMTEDQTDSSPPRPDSIHSLEPEIVHSMAAFGTSDESEEDSGINGNVPADSSAWEQEAEDTDSSERSGSEFDKRKWGDNKARVWGKRKWGDNRARVWGKRASGLAAAHHWPASSAGGVNFFNKFQAENRKLIDEAMNANSGKRKWGENKARVWGK